MDKIVLMRRLVVTMLLATIASDSIGGDGSGLSRSEEVIAHVRTIEDAAICGTTVKLAHADCQYDRCTQKCYECRNWDVCFVDRAPFRADLVRTCAICGERLKFISGFLK